MAALDDGPVRRKQAERGAHWLRAGVIAWQPPAGARRYRLHHAAGGGLRVALGDLYGWYDGGEYMLEKTTRDAEVVAGMRPVMDGMAAWLAAAAEIVGAGRSERGARRTRARAVIGHALEFETWRSLVRHQGLSQREAIRLMVALVVAA